MSLFSKLLNSCKKSKVTNKDNNILINFKKKSMPKKLTKQQVDLKNYANSLTPNQRESMAVNSIARASQNLSK